MEIENNICSEYLEIDYTELLEEIRDNQGEIRDNQIKIMNNDIEKIEIFSIVLGLAIGLSLGSLFVKVVFHGN